MDLKQEFVEAVSEHFRQLTRAFDAELASVAQMSYPRATKFLLFEYDSPTFGEEFSVFLSAMDANGEPIGDGYQFLQGKAVTVPAELYEADKYEEIDPWATASELLESWLIERWSNVAGTRKAYPAFVGHHDSYFKTNLMTGQQINWDEILGNVGS